MLLMHGRPRGCKRSIWWAACPLAIAILATGCGSSSSAGAGTNSSGTNVNKVVNGKFQKPIVIGAAVATSGLNEVNDTPPMQGMKFAIEDINKAGGIDGQPLKLVTANTNSTVAGSRTAALKVIRGGAQILVNTCNYDFGVSGGAVGQSSGVLDWSLCAASPKWGVAGIGEMAYVPSIMTYPEGWADAKFGVSRLGKSVFAFCDTFIDYTQQVCQGFKDSISAVGGKIVGSATWNDQKSTSIKSQITKIKSTPGVQWIEMPTLQPAGAQAVRQIRAAGIDVPIVQSTASYGFSWEKSVPGLDDLYIDTEASTVGDDPRSDVNDLSRRYKAKFGDWPDNANFYEGYAMTQITAQALKAKKTTNGLALAQYMDGTHSGGKRTFDTVAGPKTFTTKYHFDPGQPLVIVKYSTPSGEKYPAPKYVTTVHPQNVNLHLSP